jgi:hypothetical protein
MFVGAKLFLFMIWSAFILSYKIDMFTIYDGLFNDHQDTYYIDGNSNSLSVNLFRILHEFTSEDSSWYNNDLDEFQRQNLNIHLKAPILLWTLEKMFWFENRAMISLTKVNLLDWTNKLFLSESAYVLDELVNTIHMSIESDQIHHKFYRWFLSFTQNELRAPTMVDLMNFRERLLDILKSYTSHEILFYKQITMKKMLKLVIIEIRCKLYSNIPFATYTSLQNVKCSSIFELDLNTQLGNIDL